VRHSFLPSKIRTSCPTTIPTGSAHAENLPNLSPKYYANLAAGSDPDFTRVYVDGLYGYVKEGKPVYAEYNDAMHCAEVEPVPGLTIKRGWDFGLTPACVFTQMRPDGRWIIFEELCGDDMGISTFADCLMELCSERFAHHTFEDYGDPAGQPLWPRLAGGVTVPSLYGDQGHMNNKNGFRSATASSLTAVVLLSGCVAVQQANVRSEVKAMNSNVKASEAECKQEFAVPARSDSGQGRTFQGTDRWSATLFCHGKRYIPQ
jgi:hypothetical protein